MTALHVYRKMFACKLLLLACTAAAAVAAAGEDSRIAVTVEVKNSSQVAAAKAKASSTTARPPTTVRPPTAAASTAAADNGVHCEDGLINVTWQALMLAVVVGLIRLTIWTCLLAGRIGSILCAGGKCLDLVKVFLPQDMFAWEIRRMAAEAKSRELARADKVKEDFTYGRLRRRDGDGDAETVDTML